MLYLLKDHKFTGHTFTSDAPNVIKEFEKEGFQCAWYDTVPSFHERWINTPADGDSEISVDLTLDEYKTFKKTQVENATKGFDAERKDSNMTFKSSLGFVVDGDARSRDNLSGLINIGAEPVKFVDHDNNIQSLTLDNLKLLLVEAQKNGAMLYQQKWVLQAKIDACKTLNAVDKVQITFEMADFS